MWYISSVENFALNSNTRFLDQVVHLNKANPVTSRVTVKLTNSETGETVSLHNYENPNRFFQLMESYKPYGYFEGIEYHGSVCFMPIDQLSIKFLDYVDRVDVVQIGRESSAFDFLTKVSNDLIGSCTSVDSACSLFKVGFHRHYKTLLQVLCFKPCQTFNGDFYIYNADIGADMFSVFKPIFSDVAIAKRMIAKASLKWSEPWHRYSMLW